MNSFRIVNFWKNRVRVEKFNWNYGEEELVISELFVTEREAGGETEMGLAAFGQVAKGYHAGVQRGLRAEHNGEEAGHVRP